MSKRVISYFINIVRTVYSLLIDTITVVISLTVYQLTNGFHDNITIYKQHITTAFYS